MAPPVTCPHCHAGELEEDAGTGQTVCTNCGAVLEESNIVSSVEFMETAAGTSSVIGQFVSATATKPYGVTGPGYGLSRESREVAIENGRRTIQMVASNLNLSPHFVDSAHRLYILAVHQHFTQGRRTAHVVAACLYIVCRREKSPHLLIDFAEALQANVYTLGACFLKFTRMLSMNLPIVDPSLFIHRFAARLELGEATHTVSMTALRLVARMRRDWIQTGRRPAGICGACLLIAARMHGFRRTRGEIMQVVRVTDITLRNRLAEFENTPAASISADPDDADGLDLLEDAPEADPPSFIRGLLEDEFAKEAAMLEDAYQYDMAGGEGGGREMALLTEGGAGGDASTVAGTALVATVQTGEYELPEERAKAVVERPEVAAILDRAHILGLTTGPDREAMEGGDGDSSIGEGAGGAASKGPASILSAASGMTNEQVRLLKAQALMSKNWGSAMGKLQRMLKKQSALEAQLGAGLGGTPAIENGDGVGSSSGSLPPIVGGLGSMLPPSFQASAAAAGAAAGDEEEDEDPQAPSKRKRRGTGRGKQVEEEPVSTTTTGAAIIRKGSSGVGGSALAQLLEASSSAEAQAQAAQVQTAHSQQGGSAAAASASGEVDGSNVRRRVSARVMAARVATGKYKPQEEAEEEEEEDDGVVEVDEEEAEEGEDDDGFVRRKKGSQRAPRRRDGRSVAGSASVTGYSLSASLMAASAAAGTVLSVAALSSLNERRLQTKAIYAQLAESFTQEGGSAEEGAGSGTASSSAEASAGASSGTGTGTASALSAALARRAVKGVQALLAKEGKEMLSGAAERDEDVGDDDEDATQLMSDGVGGAALGGPAPSSMSSLGPASSSSGRGKGADKEDKEEDLVALAFTGRSSSQSGTLAASSFSLALVPVVEGVQAGVEGSTAGGSMGLGGSQATVPVRQMLGRNVTTRDAPAYAHYRVSAVNNDESVIHAANRDFVPPADPSADMEGDRGQEYGGGRGRRRPRSASNAGSAISGDWAEGAGGEEDDQASVGGSSTHSRSRSRSRSRTRDRAGSMATSVVGSEVTRPGGGSASVYSAPPPVPAAPGPLNTFDDIPDDDIDSYLLPSEEANKRNEMWKSLHEAFLKERAEKAAAKAARKAVGGMGDGGGDDQSVSGRSIGASSKASGSSSRMPDRSGHARASRGAANAKEAAKNLLSTNRLSKKLNVDALNSLDRLFADKPAAGGAAATAAAAAAAAGGGTEQPAATSSSSRGAPVSVEPSSVPAPASAPAPAAKGGKKGETTMGAAAPAVPAVASAPGKKAAKASAAAASMPPPPVPAAPAPAPAAAALQPQTQPQPQDSQKGKKGKRKASEAEAEGVPVAVQAAAGASSAPVSKKAKTAAPAPFAPPAPAPGPAPAPAPGPVFAVPLPKPSASTVPLKAGAVRIMPGGALAAASAAAIQYAAGAGATAVVEDDEEDEEFVQEDKWGRPKAGRGGGEDGEDGEGGAGDYD